MLGLDVDNCMTTSGLFFLLATEKDWPDPILFLLGNQFGTGSPIPNKTRLATAP
jgi:hypothetical protein